MLRCAASFVIVAYDKYASFLRICAPCLRTSYEAVRILTFYDLHPDAYDLWLDKDVNSPKQLKSLYPPNPSDLMTIYPVSTLVNSPQNDNPACIEPIPS